ncbi:hypothetical protein [Azospirillum baldaniorum]|uniref:hypothetical protein n=1 Tax=Azospirillum baldaniorum TaxID=1064539 RepID=UPI0011A65B9B|nr:hypothetical protein [Azospirillum baldaniorum]
MKLTKAQERLAQDMADGTKLVRGTDTGAFYLESPSGAVSSVSGVMVYRMIGKNAVRPTDRLDRRHGRIYELTEAGRAALSRHKGDAE